MSSTVSADRSRRPIPQHARTARRLLIAIPIGLLLATVSVRVIVNLDVFRRKVAIAVAEALANRTGGSVQLSGVSFDWKLAPCFQNLEIYALQGPYRLNVATQQACVEQWFSAVGSGFRAIRVRLDAPALRFTADSDREGLTPFVDVKPATATASVASQRPVLRELTVVFDDLRLAWDKVPVPERLATGAVGPLDGQIVLQRRGPLSAATIAIREPDSGARIDGRATPTEDGWDLSAAVEGDLVRIFGRQLQAARLDIRKMPCHGRLGARYGQRRLTLDLDLEEYDVDFAAGLVSRGRVIGLDGRQRFRMTADFEAGRVELGPGVIEFNGVPIDVALRIQPDAPAADGPRRPADRPRSTDAPFFSAQLALRTLSMSRLLRSVPATPMPAMIREIDPRVRLALSFEVAGRLSDAGSWQPKLEHRLVGVAQDTRTGLEFLRGPFPYRPLTNDGQRGTAIMRGPSTPGWVSYDDVPYVQRRAIIIAEDSTFPFHRGIELAEVKDAIQAAIEQSQRIRGGSTLTQQLVKNLFLNRDRTALRKVAELLLTFHLESILTKPQIFELYVNLIEWGPGLHGLHAAAHHYFGRPPRRLTPLEMAYLASVIPSPVRHHGHYEQGRVPPRFRRKVNLLLTRLHRLGQLSDEAFATAMNDRIRFARTRNRSAR